ncbi:MAG: xanthine dehydrogenase family protein subunit M [Deltaproteobacteria bacterium]|nr:MAG: xanthine dehydrogenase family protein subunit M [Deltaproteobacteria bacterium]
MKPAAFVYHRAHDVEETVGLLARLGPEAKILAGGQSLVPMLSFRLARPSALEDVMPILDLAYLRRDADGLHVGALTRHRALETTRDASIHDGFGVLPRSAHWIGHYPIRSRGTFGGSIAHGDPTSEWCLLAVLLEARVVLQGPRGRRTLAAEDFFQGFLTTAAEPDEMVVEVCFPRPAPRAALTEFSQRQGDFAVVAAAVDLEVADGACRSARVVLGGVGPELVVVESVEDAVRGRPPTGATWREVGELAARQIDPPSDVHGSRDYRRRLAAVLVVRGLAEAAA